MNPRQRRGLLLIAISGLGLLGVFVLVAQYVAGVRDEVEPKVRLLALAQPVKANQALTDAMLTTVEMPQRWAPVTAMRDPADVIGLVAGTDLTERSLLQDGMLVAPPDLAPGEREVAILVDAETGVAGKIGPGKRVDIVATFPASERKAAQARVVVAAARIVEVGQVRLKGADNLREQQNANPGQVVPVTFALSPEQVLVVNYAEQNASGVRLSLLRPGEEAADQEAARLPARAGPGAAAVSHRLLLAIADADVASSAAALAQEGEGLEVVAVVDDAEEVTRALRRYEVDVVVLHDALGAAPVLDVAREIGQTFPEVGLVLIAADDSTELLRAAMQAGLRDVVSSPLSLEQLEGSVRAAAQWSRSVRDRVAGEESAAGALGGQLIAIAGSKGGVGTTTVALQLTLAAVRAAPGRPVCLVDFDLQKGDLRGYLNLPYRRSVVDLVEVANEISVRHLQETLYTHKEGFRRPARPRRGRARGGGRLGRRPRACSRRSRRATR